MEESKQDKILQRIITGIFALFALLLFYRYSSYGKTLQAFLIASQYLLMALLLNIAFGKRWSEIARIDKINRLVVLVILLFVITVQYLVATRY